MNPTGTLAIQSEEDAFNALAIALQHEIGDSYPDIKFDGWPVLEIKLEGPGFDSTVTADLGAALVEIQHAMNRTYARMVRDSADSRSLTSAERESLQFKAKVERGSSIVKVDIGEFAEKLCAALVNKMSTEALVITILGVAIIAGGVFAFKSFLRHRTEEKKIDADTAAKIALSQEETKRAQLIIQAMHQKPQLDNARQDFDIARTEIVRSGKNAESITLAGVRLDQETARVVALAKRQESKEVQLNGTYTILKTDWQQENEIRLKIKNVDSAQEFYASFTDDSLDRNQITAIQSAEWRREHVFLSVNATELRGQITTATVIGVGSKLKSADD